MKYIIGFAVLGILTCMVNPASADVSDGNFLSGTGLGGTNNPGSYTGINYDSSLSGYYGYCNTCSIAGWTVTGSVDWIGTYWSAPNSAGQAGGYSVDLDGLEAPGAISQTVTGLTQGGGYALSFYVNGNDDGAPQPNKYLEVDVAGGNPSSKTYSPIAWVPENQSLSNWAKETYYFTATGTSAQIKFLSTDPFVSLGNYPGASFGPVVAGVSLSAANLSNDNSISQATPEPEFFAALGLGLSGLFVATRRRSKG